MSGNVTELTIPLVNPNERDALIAGLHVNEGQKVKKGELLYTLETTKSTLEVHSEGDGYLLYIQAAEGQTVSAGDFFAYLAPSADWRPEQPKAEKESTVTPEGELPAGLRITQPALELVRKRKLALSELPIGPLVTEEFIQAFINKAEDNTLKAKPDYVPDIKAGAIIVWGAGGHGKAVIELIRAIGGYKIIGVGDDFEEKEVLGVPPIPASPVELRMNEGVQLAANAVGGIGDVNGRIKVFNMLNNDGFGFPTLIHPTAFVETSAHLQDGVHVFPQAYIGSEAHIGFGCIINTGAIVSHDCVLADYVNLSPGAILAGAVEVGQAALIGMGVTVNLGVKIGSRARIGNGATVKSDVPEGGIVRAGSIWPE